MYLSVARKTLVNIMAITSLLFGICFSVAYAESVDSPREVLKAKQFLLVDDDGKIRAGLGFEGKDPILFFTNEDGKGQFYLTLMEGMPGLVMRNRDMVPKLMLRVSKNGLPRVILLNESKKPSMILMISNKNEPKVIMFDTEMQPKLMAGISDGTPSIGFMEHKRQLSFALGLDKDDEPLMFFRDRDGKIDFGITRKYGQPQMYFGGDIGEQLYMGTPHGIPYIGVKHGGRMVWSAHPPGVLVPDIPDTSFKLDDMMDLMNQ